METKSRGKNKNKIHEKKLIKNERVNILQNVVYAMMRIQTRLGEKDLHTFSAFLCCWNTVTCNVFEHEIACESH